MRSARTIESLILLKLPEQLNTSPYRTRECSADYASLRRFMALYFFPGISGVHDFFAWVFILAVYFDQFSPGRGV